MRCGFVTGTSGVASGNAAAGSSRPRALGVTRPSTRPAGFFLRGRTSRKRIRRLERGRPRVLPLPSWTRLSEPGRGLGGHSVTGGRVNHAGRAPRPPKNPLSGASALPGSSRRVTGSPRPLARWPLPIPMRLRGWGRLCRSAFSQTSSPAGCCFGGANAWSENLGFSRLWLKACNAQLPGGAAQVRTPGSRNVHPGFAPRKPG